MNLRYAFLAIAALAGLAGEAPAQFFGPSFGGVGGYPFGGYQGLGGYPGYGYPGMGGYPGYGGVPTIWQSSPIRAFTTSQTVVRPLLPPDSPLLRDPRFWQWAQERGHYLQPGETAPRSRATMWPATPIDGSELSAGPDNRAHLQVVVPSADAAVFLNGTQMSQTGTVRDFVTPALTPGKEYTFDIRMRDGSRTASRTVTVRAGSQQSVDLTN